MNTTWSSTTSARPAFPGTPSDDNVYSPSLISSRHSAWASQYRTSPRAGVHTPSRHGDKLAASTNSPDVQVTPVYGAAALDIEELVRDLGHVWGLWFRRVQAARRAGDSD